MLHLFILIFFLTPGLTLFNKSRAHLNFDASVVNTDTDTSDDAEARCELALTLTKRQFVSLIFVDA